MLFPRENNASAPNLSTLPCTCPDQRSIWNILWSCLSTILLCSWAAIHPNIPAPNAKWWHVALTRLELMIWTIIAPELMILLAMRQWVGARGLAKKYKDRGWTKTHGYFMQMGGFMLFEGKVPSGILSADRLETMLKEENIEFPSITEAEIQDRSKGDALSKTLVIGQTMWFIAQVLSRRTQGLVITELELVTLGFAALNGIMYFFWWNKPLDVRTSVPIYLSGTPTRDPDIENKELDAVQAIDSLGNISTKIEPSAGTEIVYRWAANVVSLIVHRPFDMASWGTGNHYSHIIAEGDMQVHTFYALDLSDMHITGVLHCITVIGVFFGAIHCAGWDFLFPSYPETILWRASSLVIIAVPFFFFLAFCFGKASTIAPKFTERVLNRLAIIFFQANAFVGLPLYVLARFALLAEALAALRQLPPAALGTVQWTSFLPHI